MMESCALLTNLDAILDTRMAIIATMVDEDKLLDITKVYRTKKDIAYPHLNVSDFLYRYDLRTIDDLKRAYKTEMFLYIREYVRTMYVKADQHYETLKPKIILNLHPYKLTNDEEAKLIQLLVMNTAKMADIELIDLSYNELTTYYLIENNVSILALYDYYNWLEAATNNASIKIKPVPDITLIGPELNMKPHIPVSPEVKSKLLQINRTPLDILREAIKTYIKLIHYPPELFCYDVSELSLSKP